MPTPVIDLVTVRVKRSSVENLKNMPHFMEENVML